MQATAEREGRGLTAGDVQGVRIGVDLRVTVAGAEQHQDDLACRDLDVGDHGVDQRRPAVGLHRGVEPQQFLHGGPGQAGTLTQQVGLPRRREQGRQPVADQVRRGLEARREQEDRGSDALVVVELVLAARGGEPAEQVVARTSSLLDEQVADVGGELVLGADRGLHRSDVRAGLQRGDQVPHPRRGDREVDVRDTQQVADHPDRQRQGQFGDDVDHVATGEPVEQRGDPPHDRWAQRLDVPGGEHRRHQPPQPGVVGRVAEQHGPAEPAQGLPTQVLGNGGELEAQRLVHLAQRAVAQRRLAVAVPAEHEQAGGGPQARCLFAQAPVPGVRAGGPVVGEQYLHEHLLRVRVGPREPLCDHAVSRVRRNGSPSAGTGSDVLSQRGRYPGSTLHR